MTSEQDKKLQALDLKIAKALQIDVPELRMPELPDIETQMSRRCQRSRRSMKPLWFAIAATVVLAASISLRTSRLFQSYDSLAEEVLAHLDHEPGALRITDSRCDRQRLARAVPASLGEFRARYVAYYLRTDLRHQRQRGTAPGHSGAIRAGYDFVDAGGERCGSNTDSMVKTLRESFFPLAMAASRSLVIAKSSLSQYKRMW